MKILLLADHMENGGAETHIYELSRLLSLSGHSVIVLSFGGKIAESLAAQGIHQEAYGNVPLLKLASLIRNEKPNVIHAHTRKSAFLCRVLLSFMEFPFVFTAHAHFSTETLKRTLSFFPRRTIAVSTDIAHHLIKSFGVSPQAISVIENGIDTDRFCPKRDKTKSVTILTVSRLDEDCSLTASLLCRIAPMLSRHFENLHITIVGGGNELKSIRKLAKNANKLCGKEVVQAIGKRQDVLPYLQNATLFVGVSRAALEAMSCGIPVILSGNEGYLGIAVGNTLMAAEKGNFCARGYPKAKEECLYRDILKLMSDPTLACRAREEALRQIRLYHTAEKMAEKTQKVYQAAIFDFIRSRKSDILLCGYYGYGNLGDELTLRAICSRLYAAEAASRLGENLSCSSLLPISKARLSVLTPKGKQYKGLISVDRFHPIAVFRAMRRTGLFMLGGGSLLQNKTSNRSLFYYLFLLETAHFLGVPTMLYASGIGPVRGKLPSVLCRHALLKTDLITVRDTASLALLHRMGIRDNVFLSADPVLFFKMPQAKRSGYVLAFVRDEEITLFFTLLKKINKPICLAVMDKRSDLAATKKLAAKLRKQGKKIILCKDFSVQKIISVIRGADFVVSARLHALILSFCMGIPFLGLSDDPKITAFSRMAYEDCGGPINRADIPTHFRKQRSIMTALAASDAARALALSSRRFVGQKSRKNKALKFHLSQQKLDLTKDNKNIIMVKNVKL